MTPRPNPQVPKARPAIPAGAISSATISTMPLPHPYDTAPDPIVGRAPSKLTVPKNGRRPSTESIPSNVFSDRTDIPVGGTGDPVATMNAPPDVAAISSNAMVLAAREPPQGLQG